MKILMIAPYMICPPNSGGAKRMIQPLLKIKENDGFYFDILFTGSNNTATSFLKNIPCVNEVYGVKRFEISSLPSAERFDFVPEDVWNSMDKNLLDKAAQLVQENRYDIIQIEHSYLAWIVPKLKRLSPKSKFILDNHNCEYRFYETKLCYCETDAERTETQKKYELIKKFEFHIWNYFDAIFTVSSVEAEIIKNTSSSIKIYDCPVSGVNIQEYAKNIPFSQRKFDIVYLGTLSWGANVHGLVWFIKKVFPLIQKSLSNIKLTLAGFGNPCTELAETIKENPQIELLGEVENDADVMNNARCFIVPLFIGAGSRVKISVAWASYTPMATTVFAPEGNKFSNGENILMSDEPEEYAKNVIKLLTDDNLASKIVQNGFETARQFYSADTYTEQLKTYYKEIVEL